MSDKAQLILFASSVAVQLRKRKKLKLRERRLLALLEKPTWSDREERAVRRLEAQGAAHLHVESDGVIELKPGGIDWANIDWAKFFENLLKFLLALLPLFIAPAPKANAKPAGAAVVRGRGVGKRPSTRARK